MQREQDMIGGRGLWFGLVGVSALAILSGCGMFGSSAPVPSAKARPGADAQVAAGASLPSANTGRQYDSGIAPVDETRTGPQVGSIVAGRGGQKAQKEAAEKEAIERDAKAREQRQARAAADREAKSRAPADPPSSGRTASAALSPAPAAVAPISSAPVAEPTAVIAPAAAAAASAATPEPVAVPIPQGDPNKAFVPPVGWAGP